MLDNRSFEDGIEFCLAAVDDSKTIREAHKRIENCLRLVHADKFERIRFQFGIFTKEEKGEVLKNE